MVETDDVIIAEAVHEGTTMSPLDLFGLLERHHTDGAGVSRDLVDAYANALAAQRDFAFDAEAFLAGIDDRQTDVDSWAGYDRVYELGDGWLSRYPERWHRRLDGSTDATAYVRFLSEEVPEFADDVARGGAGGDRGGVPEDTLVDVIQAVGRVDRETARSAVGEARERGELAEDADQHPQAGVYQADADADER